MPAGKTSRYGASRWRPARRNATRGAATRWAMVAIYALRLVFGVNGINLLRRPVDGAIDVAVLDSHANHQRQDPVRLDLARGRRGWAGVPGDVGKLIGILQQVESRVLAEDEHGLLAVVLEQGLVVALAGFD